LLEAFLFALLALPNDLDGIDRREIERVTHLATHLVFRGGIIEPHFQVRHFPKDGTVLGEKSQRLIHRINRLRDLNIWLADLHLGSLEHFTRSCLGFPGSTVALGDIPQEIFRLEKSLKHFLVRIQ